MSKTLLLLTMVARGVPDMEAGICAGLTRSGTRGILSLYRRGVRKLSFGEFSIAINEKL